MERLIRLYEEFGQSPWLDNLTRGFLTSGQLAEWRDGGIRGLTSNPTIFQKAISGSADYDEQFSGIATDEGPVIDDYWTLVLSDITGACEVFDPLYEQSDGGDGFVSVEVDPGLAHDAAGTEAAARDLHERIARRNLMVKIPATAEGIAPIRQMLSEGRNTNITLIFSLERHREVMNAYLDGLEAYAGLDASDLSKVASVASFFVSRVDTEVDRRLEAIGTPEALALRGKAAVAQAKLAYRQFVETFSGPRWEALAARGARVQRPLWASTSTKNPAYPDTLYVDELIGPDTVNTLPDATIEAFADHGTLARRVDADVDEAETTWRQLGEVGVDLADVSDTLEREGVTNFEKSFSELLDALQTKAAELSGSEPPPSR
jgi:transaldolase